MAACPSCGVAPLVVASEPVANEKRKGQQVMDLLVVASEPVANKKRKVQQVVDPAVAMREMMRELILKSLQLNEARSLLSERHRAHNELLARLEAADGTQLELASLNRQLASFKTRIESLVTRGTFDTMVLQQLDSELTKLLEQFTHDLESGDEEHIKFEESLAAGKLAINNANDSLIAFQKGVLVALGKLCAEPVEEVEAMEAEKQKQVRSPLEQWMKQHQPTPQAVEETVPRDVSMAPADVALPVASDKIVSTHAVSVAALSPQAGA